MKKWLSSLFGFMAESTPAPQPAPPPPDDETPHETRRLDAVWSRYLALMRSPKDYQPPRPRPAPHWLDMLRKDRRFVLVVLPVQYQYEDEDRRHMICVHPHFLRHPTRAAMRAAGGFVPYCLGQPFAASIRDEVERWQHDAFAWYHTEGHQQMHHEPAAILQPDIEVHLLDADPTELVKVKLPRWPLPPPQPPPAPAKLIPPQPRPGIGQALSVPKKVKKLAR